MYIAPTAHSRPRPAPRPRSYIALPSTRQAAKAFNQQLSFDTSQVKHMEAMFVVRSTRARPQKRNLESPPTPLLVGQPPVPTPSHVLSRLPHRHHTPHLFLAKVAYLEMNYSTSDGVCSTPLLTRQGAEAFNQPLTFDTSLVNEMEDMFRVRSTRAWPSRRNLQSPSPPASRL